MSYRASSTSTISTPSRSSVRTKKLLATIGIYALWVIGTILTLLPIYWLLLVASRRRIDLLSGRPNFAPTFFTNFHWENFTEPFLNGDQGEYLLNSIIIATSNALLVVILAVMATYALSRFRLAGSDNIFFWTITNRMGPPAAFLLPLYLLYTRTFKVGDWFLYDTHIGLILIYCLFNLPFAIWLMKGIMDGIPPELDEAVLVDGGNLWTVLTRIIVPLAAPGIAITGLLTWVFAWNEYLFACGRQSANGDRRLSRVCNRHWKQLGRTCGSRSHFALARFDFLVVGATVYRHGLDVWCSQGITLTRPSRFQGEREKADYGRTKQSYHSTRRALGAQARIFAD
jgi:glycerol transport system permease protein